MRYLNKIPHKQVIKQHCYSFSLSLINNKLRCEYFAKIMAQQSKRVAGVLCIKDNNI